MNILIVGDWEWDIYEDAFSKGIRKHNISVSKFKISFYFKGFTGLLLNRFPFLEVFLKKINSNLFSYIEKSSPDVILFWRPRHILPSTLLKIRKKGIPVISYNNDSPFPSAKFKYFNFFSHWFLYLSCVPFFDINFLYRNSDLIKAKNYGSNYNFLLMSYFLPWLHKKISLNKKDLLKYRSDVVFIGHFEPDGRDQAIAYLISKGVSIRIWGPTKSWNLSKVIDFPVFPALGSEYTKALSAAKICLCFLSKKNNDTYTRRCFEIPACGKLLLAERTKFLSELFVDNKEACFFSSKEELLLKIEWLLNDSRAREKIANAGMKKVISAGHDVYSRANRFLKITYKNTSIGYNKSRK